MTSFITEPWDEYHAKRKECVTAHSLATFRRCPLEFIMERRGELVHPDSPELAFGRAAHALILEGEAAFQEQYVVGSPINPRTQQPYGRDTKAYAEWLSQQTKPVVSAVELELAMRMRESVQNHDEACKLLSDGQAEGTIRQEWEGVLCQSRLDWYTPDWGIVDLKTCSDLDRFERDSIGFEYREQMGFYSGMLALMDEGLCRAATIIAVEKRPPYRCGVWAVDSLPGLVERTSRNLWDVKKALETGAFITRYEGLRWL